MNRRNLLLGIAAVPIAGTAYALSWNDIKDAVTGHVDDIIDRRKDDAFAQVIHMLCLHSVKMI